MRVYCRCVHPNKVIRYLPAWGFPEGVVQQFGVTHHGAFEFLWWRQAALKVQKTCSSPPLDYQKSQNLSPTQSSLKPATAQFCWTLCVLPTGFVEVQGKWVHLWAEDEKDKIRYTKRLFHACLIGDSDNDNDREFVYYYKIFKSA